MGGGDDRGWKRAPRLWDRGLRRRHRPSPPHLVLRTPWSPGRCGGRSAAAQCTLPHRRLERPRSGLVRRCSWVAAAPQRPLHPSPPGEFVSPYGARWRPNPSPKSGRNRGPRFQFFVLIRERRQNLRAVIHLLSLCGQSPPQLSLKKRRISAWGAGFEATPALAGRRSGQHVKIRPTLCPSTIGNQGPLQRP